MSTNLPIQVGVVGNTPHGCRQKQNRHRSRGAHARASKRTHVRGEQGRGAARGGGRPRSCSGTYQPPEVGRGWQTRDLDPPPPPPGVGNGRPRPAAAVHAPRRVEACRAGGERRPLHHPLSHKPHGIETATTRSTSEKNKSNSVNRAVGNKGGTAKMKVGWRRAASSAHPPPPPAPRARRGR